MPLFDEQVLTEIAKSRVQERSLVTFTEKEETYVSENNLSIKFLHNKIFEGSSILPERSDYPAYNSLQNAFSLHNGFGRQLDYNFDHGDFSFEVSIISFSFFQKSLEETTCQDIEWQFLVNGLITKEIIVQSLRLADFEVFA